MESVLSLATAFAPLMTKTDQTTQVGCQYHQILPISPLQPKMKKLRVTRKTYLNNQRPARNVLEQRVLPALLSQQREERG